MASAVNGLAGGDHAGDVAAEGLRGEPQCGQRGREAVVDLGGGDQEVLGADVVVLQEAGLLLRRQHHLAGLVGEPLEHERTVPARPDPRSHVRNATHIGRRRVSSSRTRAG